MTGLTPSPGFVAPQALRSPEQLDQCISLVRPGHALMTLGLALVVVASGVWGTFGTIATQVVGKGILVSAGERMYPVATTAEGLVKDILLTPGEHIAAGQTVATLDQPEATGQLVHAKRRLAELEEALAMTRQQSDKERAERRRQTDAQLQSLTIELSQARERATRLSRILAEQDALLARGFARKLDVEQLRQNRDQAAADVSRAESHQRQAEGAYVDFEDQLLMRVADAEHRVSEQRDHVEQLALKLANSVDVRSPSEGIVEEIRISKGSVVRPGDIVATLANEFRGYEVLAFLEPYQGKQVEVGMRVHVVPGTVKKEEFGAARGVVVEVSERPLSDAGVNALLRNPTLTQHFVKDGPPVFVRVDLDEDPSAPSGLAWWTGRGPPFAIGIGTMSSAEVVVREQPPITLVVPYLKRFLGL